MFVVNVSVYSRTLSNAFTECRVTGHCTHVNGSETNHISLHSRTCIHVRTYISLDIVIVILCELEKMFISHISISGIHTHARPYLWSYGKPDYMNASTWVCVYFLDKDEQSATALSNKRFQLPHFPLQCTNIISKCVLRNIMQTINK